MTETVSQDALCFHRDRLDSSLTLS